MSEGTTAVCRECNKRFALSRRSNQHQHAGGSPHRATRFCSSACKQAAYRKRNAGRPKPARGTVAHATVTRSVEHIGNIEKIRAGKTVEPRPKPLPKLDPRIVPDAGMYRIRLRDGSLSDMVNLTRAKDAISEAQR